MPMGHGQSIRILADKGYIRLQEDIREAVGNVVITHQSMALYGEKATVSMETGEVTVVGNVRYVAPGMTLYGSELFHNFKDNTMVVKNARIMTDSFVVLGQTLSRQQDGDFFGEGAEYSTCQDCPESWAISGKEVRITVGEYIRIKHALIKVKGIVVMYIPYIMLPIKKERETGLLFPSFGYNIDEGARYQQPWFWAISDYNDLTLSPSVWGKRGFGNELQYRHVLGERKWFEINSLQVNDRIYEPYKVDDDILTGDHYFRHFTEYEHHFNFGHNWNHHFYFNDAKEMDMIRDFDDFTAKRIQGSELGGGGHIDYRTSLMNFGMESYFNRNMLVSEPRDFDNSYVQMLPKLSMSLTPQTLLQTDYFFLNNITWGFDSDYTIFKQNHFNEGSFIRNAHRLNTLPYINWELGSLGPFSFQTSAKYDHQYYNFPYQERERYFSKSGFIYESEVSFELQKIYGLAYKDYVSVEKVDIKSEKAKKTDNDLIGEIPAFEAHHAKDQVEVTRNSYRHSQIWKLKHYFMTDQQMQGSNKFLEQIHHEDGLFDYVDSIRDEQHEFSHATFRTQLPKKNTLELQLNNALIQKTPTIFDPLEDNRSLRDNFSYSQISYFNVSQGYDLSLETEEKIEALTRLHLETGVNVNRTNVNLSDYYFYQNGGHILSFAVTNYYSLGDLGVVLTYDSFASPANQKVVFRGSIRPIDLITFSWEYDYDIAEQKNVGNSYNILYSPKNNCWMLNLRRSKTLIDTKYSLNFLFNFNKNSFASFTEA